MLLLDDSGVIPDVSPFDESVYERASEFNRRASIILPLVEDSLLDDANSGFGSSAEQMMEYESDMESRSWSQTDGQSGAASSSDNSQDESGEDTLLRDADVMLSGHDIRPYYASFDAKGYRPSHVPPVETPPTKQLDASEIASLRFFRIWSETNGTEDAYHQWSEFSRGLGHPVMPLHGARKLARELAGLQVEAYGMCVNSCIAFVGDYETATECPAVNSLKKTVCGEARYRSNPSGRRMKHRKVFSYIPLIPRIDALYANAKASQLMLHRHNTLQNALEVIREGSRLSMNDWSAGDLSRRLHDSGRLQLDVRDSLITLATDGAQFTMRKRSSCWLLLVNLLNLPATSGRYRKSNSFLLGAIPGPNNAGNLESFLAPFFREMAIAEAGLWLWDGLRKEYFLWRGYLVAVLGDQPASAKLNGLVGHTGRSGCRFCAMKSVFGRRPGSTSAHTPYYPLLEVFDEAPEVSSYRYDPLRLPIRSESSYVSQLQILRGMGTEKDRLRFQRQTGIRCLPQISGSKAFVFPFFCPIDISHLLFLNVIPHIYDLWTNTKLFHPDDIHNLSEQQAKRCGAEMVTAAIYLPSSFGAAPRNIFEKRNTQYKMHEFASWCFWYSIPLLYSFHPAFPRSLTRHWATFVEAATIATAFSDFTPQRIGQLRALFGAFVEKFELLYIRGQTSLLYRATLSVHQLLHIADLTQQLGSLANLSQLPMERAIGQAGRSIRSQKSPYVNLANNLINDAALHTLAVSHPETASPVAPVDARGVIVSLHRKKYRLSSKFRSRQESGVTGDDWKDEVRALQLWLSNGLSPPLQLDDFESITLCSEAERYGAVMLPSTEVLSSARREMLLAEGHRRASYFEVKQFWIHPPCFTSVGIVTS